MALIILQWVRRWGNVSGKLRLTNSTSLITIVANSCSRRFPCCVLKILSWIKNENQKQISWAGQSTNLALDYKPLASPHPISVPHSLEQTKQISVLLWYVCTKRGAILTFFHRPPPLLNRTLPPEGAPSSRPSLTETTKSSSLSWKCNFRWIESAFHPPLTPSDQTLSGQKVGTDCFYNIKRYVLS